MRVPVITVFAPTATGKTALVLKLFGGGGRSFFKGGAELVSADSMQVYRKLDIGTAKPDAEERRLLPHHLVDIMDYDRQFSVSDFVCLADGLCEDIWSRGKIPFVAGGTGFYIRNFLLGLPETPPSDSALRDELRRRLLTEGRESLYAELKRIDPESAAKINFNDEYRILRAIEVFRLSGRPRSSFSLGVSLREKFDFCTIILERSRDELYRRIEDRVDLMFSQGLENEVASLLREGASADMPGMKAIGYREWFSGDMKSECGVQDIKARIKRSSKKYAKKQYTFMKDIPGAVKVNMDDEAGGEAEVLRIVSDFLLKYGIGY